MECGFHTPILLSSGSSLPTQPSVALSWHTGFRRQGGNAPRTGSGSFVRTSAIICVAGTHLYKHVRVYGFLDSSNRQEHMLLSRCWVRRDESNRLLQSVAWT